MPYGDPDIMGMLQRRTVEDIERQEDQRALALLEQAHVASLPRSEVEAQLVVLRAEMAAMRERLLSIATQTPGPLVIRVESEEQRERLRAELTSWRSDPASVPVVQAEQPRFGPSILERVQALRALFEAGTIDRDETRRLLMAGLEEDDRIEQMSDQEIANVYSGVLTHDYETASGEPVRTVMSVPEPAPEPEEPRRFLPRRRIEIDET